MNSFSTVGILVFLPFEYCSPAQGNLQILYGVSGNKELYAPIPGTVTNLVQISSTTYKIEHTESKYGKSRTSTAATFEIVGMDTMIDADVVLRRHDNVYLEFQLTSSLCSEMLFNMTTRHKLGESLHSYKVSAVYEYDVGEILEEDVLTISEYKYSTTGTPQHRYIIHSGEDFSRDANARLLWTANDFNYFVFDNYSILLTLCRKPSFKYYRYYLVRFADKSDLGKWSAAAGQLISADIPRASKKVQDYFLDSVGKA